MRSRNRIGVGFGLLLSGLLLPLVAGAELAKWDQERVTKYATELSAACDELVVAVRNDDPGVNISQQQARYRARETVKAMCTSARQLQAHLESGKGREETDSIYQKLATLRRDAEEEARRALISEPTMEKIFGVGGPLLRLRPYYQAEPAPEE